MQTKVAISLSLLLVVLVFGCGPKATPSANNKPDAAMPSDAHTHGSGPHGGTIADWGGGQFHIELTVDHDKKEATVYILGGDAESPSPIKTEKLLLSINEPQFQLELLPNPLDGEADGSSSRFIGTDDHLGVVQEFAGTISGEVNGKSYAGDFQEEPESPGQK